MSGKFNMDDYVDVAERVAAFKAAYPDMSLQSELEAVRNAGGDLIAWMCRAEAYRTPDDPRPGVGHAVEPVPGRTPYTKDSEAMNAETSAWGRAIVALGFPTKKIASRQEVRNRSDTPPEPTFKAPTRKPAPPPEPGQLEELTVLVDELILGGHVTGEQIQHAAQTAKPWPQLAEDLTREQVESLIARLGRHRDRLMKMEQT